MKKNLQKTFLDNGYFFYNDLFSKDCNEKILNEISSLANLFVKKIPNLKIKNKIKKIGDIDKFCKKLEKYNKDYFFNFITLVSSLKTINKLIIDDKIVKLSSEILKEPKESLLFSRVSFLVNIPKNKRVLYHWHNATNAYPKRNRCINFWMPILKDKKNNNGTLEICEKSHEVSNYPFLEYKSKSASNSLTQNQIPEELFKKYKRKKINLKIGSLLGMHNNIVHRSTINNSSECSFVCVFKVWSISKDWTVSSDLNQKYFIGDSGAGSDIKIT
tara:strand:- start:1077 stop:1895 length:819 start_codon:yes stop_codon:yes gene_type:complete